MVNSLKKYQNYSYDVNSASSSGMNWGSPTPGATQQSPTSCNAHNIVYFNTHNTYVRLREEVQDAACCWWMETLPFMGGFNGMESFWSQGPLLSPEGEGRT